MRLFFLLFWAVTALATEAPTPAPVTFEGQQLFVFRTRIGSIPPQERARLILRRIERLSEDRLFDLNSIVARDGGEIGWEVLAGDQVIMVISREEAKLDGSTPQYVAERVATRLKEVLAEDRRMKSPHEIAIRAAYTAAALVFLLLMLWGLRYFYRRLDARIRQRSVIRSINIKGLELVSIEHINFFLTGALRLVYLTLVLGLLYFFVPLVLSFFPMTARLSPILLGYVLSPLRQIARSVIAFVPNLFFIVLNVLVARYALKAVRILFDAIENGTLRFSGFYPEWARPTYQLVRGLAIAFTGVIIFPYIPGSSSPAFQGVSVFLGLLVSLGSTSAIANVVAGIVITYMRSFRPGDRVKIADTTGDIVEKALLITRIRTTKNVDVTIPNSLVLSNHIVNYTALAATDGLILNTEVTIGYDAPWRKVHELLIQAALRTEGIMKEPAPFVYQTALDDFYVRYQINAYTRKAGAMQETYSTLNQNIQDCFNEGGVEIMSPHYASLRDGNTVTIPEDQRPPDYQAPSFRLS